MKVDIWVLIEDNWKITVVDEATENYTHVWVRWGEPEHGVIDKIDDDSKVYVDEFRSRMDTFLEYELVWKRLLLEASWFSVEREGADLTEESWKQVCVLHPLVARRMISPITSQLFMGRTEELRIERDARQLFAKDSSGVRWPCSAVRKYCALQRAKEKLGLNLFEIQKLPQALWLRLK
ncbi:unnamed protein product, partial [marine sediment metagenome]